MITDTRDRIVNYIKKSGPARPHELASFLGIGKVALHRQLRKLEAEGLIIKEGKAPRVTYRAYDPQQEARRLAEVIKPVLRRYRVSKAELFGSVAYGELKPESDVDVLVELPKGASLFDLGGLYMDLKEVIGRDVDVVPYDSVHHRIRENVFSKTFKVI